MKTGFCAVLTWQVAALYGLFCSDAYGRNQVARRLPPPAMQASTGRYAKFGMESVINWHPKEKKKRGSRKWALPSE
jgi:hypothetical protein